MSVDTPTLSWQAELLRSHSEPTLLCNSLLDTALLAGLQQAGASSG